MYIVKQQVKSSAIVPLTVDAQGKVRHDVLLRQGSAKDKVSLNAGWPLSKEKRADLPVFQRRVSFGRM